MVQYTSVSVSYLTMNGEAAEKGNVDAAEEPSLVLEEPSRSTEKLSEKNVVDNDGSEVDDIPPNGGYGWVFVAAAFALNASVWGINSSFGVFLAYYLAHDIFPDTTAFAFAFIGGLSISQALIVSPLITITTRLWGVRVTLLTGVLLVSIGLVGASFANELWHLILSQGVCYGWGMGFLYVGSLGILPQWFTTHRSLAVGIAASGAGVGGIIYNLVANVLNKALGWRWALRVLAASGFAVNLTCAFLLRDRNKQIKPSMATLELKLLARYEILLIVMWGCLSELGYIVLYYSMPSYAASIGLSEKKGSVAGTMLNVGLAVGRPIMGHYSDTSGRINMATAGTAFCGVLCLVVWIFAKSYGVLLFFALMAGTVSGTFWSTIAPVGAEVVGLKELPSALSMTWLLLVVPCTFAEPIAVVMVGGTGDSAWLKPQLFVGFMFISAALCTLALRAWKIVELEKRVETEDGENDGTWSTLVSGHNSILQVIVLHLQAAFHWRRI